MYTLLGTIRHLALLTAACLQVKSILNSSRSNLFDLNCINQRDQNLFIASWKSPPVTLGEKDSWTQWAGKERGHSPVPLASFFTQLQQVRISFSQRNGHPSPLNALCEGKRFFLPLCRESQKNTHGILRASYVSAFSNISVFEVVSRVTERVM